MNRSGFESAQVGVVTKNGGGTGGDYLEEDFGATGERPCLRKGWRANPKKRGFTKKFDGAGYYKNL
jgi:hypothetical protein